MCPVKLSNIVGVLIFLWIFRVKKYQVGVVKLAINLRHSLIRLDDDGR